MISSFFFLFSVVLFSKVLFEFCFLFDSVNKRWVENSNKMIQFLRVPTEYNVGLMDYGRKKVIWIVFAVG